MIRFLVRVAALALPLLGATLACRSRASDAPAPSAQAASTSSASPVHNVAVTHEILDDLDSCEARHRGLVIDLSSRALETARSFRTGPFEDIRYESRAGESVGAIYAQTLDFDVWLDHAAPGLEIAVRLQAVAARSLNLAIDGISTAARVLPKSDVAVLRFVAPQSEFQRGRHTIRMKFIGKRRGDEAWAQASWLRVYLPGDADAKFPAPTHTTLLEDVGIAGEPRRAISLRAPGSLRCGLMPGPGVRVKLNVSYRGTGTADAEVRVQTADGKSVQLWGAQLEGSEDLRWQPVDVSLDAFAGQLVALEFAANTSTGTGRTLFVEPRLERLETPLNSPMARNVIVLFAGGLDRTSIPPWGDRQGLSNLFALSEQGVSFDGYRASSSIVTSVAATLLTGAAASSHGVLSLSGRISDKLPLLSKLLRERASNSAFFTNVPSTQAAFGFDRDWGHYESHSPLEDMPAAAPLLSGTDWLRKNQAPDAGSRLLVAHVSAGHPPWDVSHEELALLPPKDYEGPIDARRGAITLREYRARAAAGRRTLTPNDWTRVSALQTLAVHKVDQGLGALFRHLHDAKLWDDALIVLLGDVGSGDRPDVPFAPDGPLTEGRLAVPLIVKFPNNRRPKAHVNTRVSTASVARTIADTLGLSVPALHQTPSLLALAEQGDPLESHPVLARSMDAYAFYLGRYVLRGSLGSIPSLYDLEADPAQQIDLAQDQPFLVQWMWRLCLREFKRGMPVDGEIHESAELDGETRNAMAAYGI